MDVQRLSRCCEQAVYHVNEDGTASYWTCGVHDLDSSVSSIIEYKMTREEFRAQLQELIIAARPNMDVYSHDVTYHLQKLEEVLFGLRGLDDDAPDVFTRFLGSQG